MSKPLTLVTGGSGHVGSNLVRALLQRGQERVRCLVRPGSNNKGVEDLDVELVYGDLEDYDRLPEIVQGCQYVYHCAAFVSFRHGDRDHLFKTNIEGTKRLMEACLKEGVKRVCYTSSFGAIRNMYPDVSDEESTFSPYELTTDYEVSKGFSEGEVLRVAAKGLDVVIVNPTGVVGPHDYKPSSVGKTILDFASGAMKTYVPGQFDFVPVQDVIAGHLLAMEKGRTGERYLLSGQICTIDQILDWLQEFTGRPRPRYGIPPKLIGNVAVVKDWVERKCFPEKAPRFTAGSIHLLNSGKRGNHSKAERELGVQFTPIKDAWRAHVKFFIEQGMLTPSTKSKL